VPAAGRAGPPRFAPSPAGVSRHADAVHPPTWQVTCDVLTGRATSTVEYQTGFRVGPSTVIEREFASVCAVDPADPAHASARGRHVCRVVRPSAVTQGRAETVIQATADHFHVTIDLEVRVNGSLHHQRRWAESVPRHWL
jgi:hypothetical protein